MAKRILLADDSITIQKVVELTFSDGDYEVTAVNNGAKAIQKLSEMRPDIILSDIIMPEKNGYEVCEYVKSHPEFRTIPVILLTGTFEPFDPDRADKAGCDAVVTKPFESQSLIHKVEELIEHGRSEAPTAPQKPLGSPFASESPFAPEPPVPPSPSDQFATGTFQPHGEIFGGVATSPPTSEMPFEGPAATGGETRAFPRPSFDDLQRMASETPAPPGGETRAFPRMTFDELQRTPPSEPATPPPAPETPPEPTPWDSGPHAASTAGDTTAPFGGPTAPPPSPMAGSPWDEQESGFAGETRAMPKMSFEDLEKMATPAPPPPMPEPTPEPPAWTPPPEPPAWTPPEPPHFELEAPPPPPPPAAEPEPAPTAPLAAGTAELTDEQVDRIARRVVQLMSETVVRNIAWEVIPDLAEMVVKERIRQLESE